MSRYIDADVFEVFGYTSQDGTFDDGVQFVLEKIDEQPTADVVEVVRCKDCRFSEPVKESDGSFYNCVTGLGVGANHFCSIGESREDDKGISN